MKKIGGIIVLGMLGLSGCAGVRYDNKEDEDNVTEFKYIAPKEEQQEENITIDESNIVSGYWKVYHYSNKEYVFKEDSDFQGASHFKFDGEKGEMNLITTGYGVDTFEDFVFEDVKEDTQRGIGQKFEEAWNKQYSMKREITAKKINDDIVLMRLIDSYFHVFSDIYILERVDKDTYDSLTKGYESVEDKEATLVKTNEMNAMYKDDVERYFGTATSWLYGDKGSYGELGRGNDMAFNEAQLEAFKGLSTGNVFPDNDRDQTEYDDVYYGLSGLQDQYALSKEDETYGVITLTSKADIQDAILYGETEAAMETKNSLIHLLMKATKNKEKFVSIKVVDSEGKTYLVIKNGKIDYDRLNDSH